MAKILISYGVDKSRRDMFGSTAADIARRYHHEEMLELLKVDIPTIPCPWRVDLRDGIQLPIDSNVRRKGFPAAGFSNTPIPDPLESSTAESSSTISQLAEGEPSVETERKPGLKHKFSRSLWKEWSKLRHGLS